MAGYHEYVWARLPFLVPMAHRVAARCRESGRGCEELAPLVGELRAVLLDHLEREQSILEELAAEPDSSAIVEGIDRLREEHREVARLLGRIRRAWRAGHRPEDDATCDTERALHRELALLDRHIRDQVVLEEEILAGYRARRSAGRPAHEPPG